MTALFLALHEDKSGAAFIEYTALLGVILAVGLLILTGVGTWASNVWTSYAPRSLPALPQGAQQQANNSL